MMLSVIKERQNRENIKQFNMGNQRGNVILTAIFVSVFLFFLSVALLYSNRQDIALSLSMEHKLKAQAEARSLAMEAYGQLREFGEYTGALERNSTSGVSSRIQLLRVPAAEKRGELLLLRVRATSGLVNSYMTLHLEETHLASPDTGKHKAMFFPGTEGNSAVVYGDFVFRELSLDLNETATANGGPVVQTALGSSGPDSPPNSSSQPFFPDRLPVFPVEGDELRSFGPAVVVLPVVAEATSLSWLKLQGETFEWQEVPPPYDLSGQEPPLDSNSTVYQASVSGTNRWTNLSFHGVDEELFTHTWAVRKPPARHVDEIEDSLATQGGSQAEPTTEDYRSSSSGAREWFVTRGAIAALGDEIYTHAWHFLYQSYRGGMPETVSPLEGAIVTRWPCILKYNTAANKWSKVWAPLDTSGSVSTELTPNPQRLWVTSTGECYSTSLGGRLLAMQEGGRAELKGELPEGHFFFYRDIPHLLNARGILNLETEQYIGFQTLPERIPGIAGRMREIPPIESLGIDEAGVLDSTPEGAIEVTGISPHVVLPEFLLNYGITPNSRPTVDGNDLWVQVEVNSVGVETNLPAWDMEYMKENLPESGTAVGRYDGLRWQILPAGLRVFLERKRLDPPPPTSLEEPAPPPGDTLDAPKGSERLIVAQYNGLPRPVPRYTIVCIDNEAFRFNNE